MIWARFRGNFSMLLKSVALTWSTFLTIGSSHNISACSDPLALQLARFCTLNPCKWFLFGRAVGNIIFPHVQVLWHFRWPDLSPWTCKRFCFGRSVGNRMSSCSGPLALQLARFCTLNPCMRICFGRSVGNILFPHVQVLWHVSWPGFESETPCVVMDTAKKRTVPCRQHTMPHVPLMFNAIM